MVLAQDPGRDRHAAVADAPPDAAEAQRSAGAGDRMSVERTLDVSGLAPGAFGHRSILWWGTMGLIVIEGTAFALAIAMYFYIRLRNSTWPPNVPPPALLWGTLNTVVLLVSAVPNELAKKAGEKVDLAKVRLWLSVCLAFGVTFNVIRVFEFMSLNCLWNTNAYGSIVWMLLGLHTVHIATDVVDTA